MKKKDNTISPVQFTGKIKDGSFGPAYVFAGEDTYAMDNILSMIRKECIPPENEEFNLEILHADSDSVNAAEIITAGDTVPFLGGLRVIFVKYINELPASELDILGDYLEKLKTEERKELLIILSVSVLDKRTKFAKTVKDIIVNFDVRDIKNISQYIQTQYNKRISPAAVSYLELLTQGNSMSLRNEIEKVCMFAGGREEITEKDVSEVCIDSSKKNEWALSNYILQGNVAGALDLLGDIRRGGLEDMYQHAIISKAISSLPEAREALMDGTLYKNWKFRLNYNDPKNKQIEKHLRALTEPQLASLLSRLMYMEIGFKGANLPKALMSDFACLAGTTGATTKKQ